MTGKQVWRDPDGAIRVTYNISIIPGLDCPCSIFDAAQMEQAVERAIVAFKAPSTAIPNEE